MVKNWNVSQVLPVPFTKWHFQISPHFHPLTVRCYFPYVNKPWFITSSRGKQISLKEIFGIFFFLGRWISIFLPAIGFFFFQITCTLIVLSLPSTSEEKGRQELPSSFSSGYRGGISRQGDLPPPHPRSLEILVWPAQCSQIISFIFFTMKFMFEIYLTLFWTE